MGRTKPVDIGTKAATAVCRALRPLGFPHAERRDEEGRHDRGDITGIPGVVVQVKGGEAAKGASAGQIHRWMHGDVVTQTRNARADVGLLVTQRRGIGLPNAHQWQAHLFLADIIRLAAGVLNATDPDPAAGLPCPDAIVTVTVETAALLLRAGGYGEPLPAATTRPDTAPWEASA